ncbi:Nucleosomal histone H3-Lys79 methylase [Entomophthora muscae]|uniref:Nucleosomal histone H3-Lys79 methylase n=1 Tax=Entomophthora muscae TaxID=34485 RepID=A0ACC2SZV2_9FUNG|nr:Nucleosomal histone H3-Lys79 methylase [Entomophthora muscae]
MSSANNSRSPLVLGKRKSSSDVPSLTLNQGSKPSKIPKIPSPTSSITEEIPTPEASTIKTERLRYIQSIDLIQDINSIFKPFFKSFGLGVRVTLEYPNPNYNEKFYLVLAYTEASGGTEVDTEEYNPIQDILDTIVTVSALSISSKDRKRFGSEDDGLFRNILRAKNRKDGKAFLECIREYNSLVKEIRGRDGFKRNCLPSQEVLEHIIYQCYARVVSPDADNLTNYKAFSNQVYGEVNSSLIGRFIKLANIDKRSLFVDMGCGIGNVVIQIAGQTGCKTAGIEIMELPANLSKFQRLEFMARCEMYQLPSPKIKLVKGDFLTHPDILALLPKADVLLINNYVFKSSLNLKIKDLFLKLKDGCRIISLKSFAPIDFRVNSRNAGEPESILRVEKFEYGSDSVSWTANPGQFFIHTVDRKPLHRFLERAGSS